MKAVKSLILCALIFGGAIVCAGGCEAFNIPCAFIGLAMMGVGVILANHWEEEMLG